MSFFYKKNDNESTRELYLKTFVYNGEISEPEYENLINFYEAERYMYGRVNYSYVPIIYDSTRVPLATLSTTNTEQSNLQAAAYVVDAFNALNEKFNTKLLTGEIDANDPFLARLEVKKAYQDPILLYNQHLAQIQEVIFQQVIEKNIKFSNYEQFIPIFEKITSEISKTVPITLPGFMKSKFCPMNVSGLVIEIADIDYKNDEEKILKFKNSRNWLFYLNACRSYGFYVDSSNPFRLIANIGSPEMLEYARTASQCRFTSALNILTESYIPAHLNYIDLFKELMFNTYNLCSTKSLVVEHCLNGTTVTKLLEPTEYTFNEFLTLIDESFYIKKYIDFRFNETNTGLKDYQKNTIVRNTLSLYKSKGIQTALNNFENSIAPTFNYSGALTDLIRRDIIIEQEGIDVLSNT